MTAYISRPTVFLESPPTSRLVVAQSVVVLCPAAAAVSSKLRPSFFPPFLYVPNFIFEFHRKYILAVLEVLVALCGFSLSLTLLIYWGSPNMSLLERIRSSGGTASGTSSRFHFHKKEDATNSRP